MRKKIVVGNWKMNKNYTDALWLVSEIATMVRDEVLSDVEVVLAPPFVYSYSVQKLIESYKNISLGAQNCSQHPAGAYTGEISAEMLASIKTKYVIIGHSERREYFEENSEIIAQKVSICLENALIPIFCCGENLDLREDDAYFDFIKRQIGESLFHLSKEQFSSVVIAYEPIWAIGTGKTATSAQAQEVHQFIRKVVFDKYGAEIAENLSVLYGGSCKPDNAKELFSCPDVDGGLIGGASLKSRDFTDVIKAI